MLKRVLNLTPPQPPPPPIQQPVSHPYWNVSLIPLDEQAGILNILQRDFDCIWDDARDREDAGYPVVIDKKTGELCWKMDMFVMDAFTYKYMQVDLTQLAMDPEKQWFRKSLYKKFGYSLRKYHELFFSFVTVEIN